jgi:hypothetical protein
MATKNPPTAPAANQMQTNPTVAASPATRAINAISQNAVIPAAPPFKLLGCFLTSLSYHTGGENTTMPEHF